MDKQWELIYPSGKLGPVEATFVNKTFPHFELELTGDFEINHVTILYRQSILATLSGKNLPKLFEQKVNPKIERYAHFVDRIDWINHQCLGCGEYFLRSSINEIIKHVKKQCFVPIKSASKF